MPLRGPLVVSATLAAVLLTALVQNRRAPSWRRFARRHYLIRLLHSRLLAVRLYWPAMLRSPWLTVKWALFDPEVDNWTYRVANLDELADFLAVACAVDPATVRGFIAELDHDDELRLSLIDRLRLAPECRRVPLYGRRAGWYALVRLLRPRLVIETGVHHGLGSCVLLQALARNAAEGQPGRLIGIDTNPEAGWLVPPRLRPWYTLVTEDSATALPRIAAAHPQQIDLFLHDSDHAYAHETAEYRAVMPALSPGGVLLSDNAHGTTALRDIAAQHGYRYAFWRERPAGHFYPGAGIGLSLPAQVTTAVFAGTR